MAGWVRLWRDFADDEIWKERRSFSRAEAWIDLLMMQSYKKESVMRGGAEHEVIENECAVSERYLATRWNWTRRKVGCYLLYLERRKMIVRTRNKQATIIRIVDVPPNVPPYVPQIEPLNDGDNEGVIQMNVPPNVPPNVPLDVPQEKEVRSNKYISTTTARAHVRDEIREMSANGIWIETICMRFRLKPPDVLRLLDEFATDCECRGRNSHYSVQGAMSSFTTWMENKKYKDSKDGTGNQRRSTADIIQDTHREGIEEAMRFIQEAKRARGEL